MQNDKQDLTRGVLVNDIVTCSSSNKKLLDARNTTSNLNKTLNTRHKTLYVANYIYKKHPP